MAPTIEPPHQVGLDLTPPKQAWSIARLQAIFRDAQRNPSAATLDAARHARHCLSRFWLTVPVDLLEALYGGSIGDLQRQQLNGPLPRQGLASDEAQWRDLLITRLKDSEAASQKINLLLALMPYAPPQRLSVEDPLTTLPRWLLGDYVAYCQPELKHQLSGPAGLLTPGGQERRQSQLPMEASGPLPPLSARRGEAAMEWFRDEEALNRMQALINLYGLDPRDPETLEELSALRLVVAQLWLDVEDSQLEMLYQTPVGLLTRSLYTSGFGKEVLQDLDRTVRRVLPTKMADFRQTGAANAFLALLPFCPPGSVSIVDPEGVPAWLLKELSLL